MAHSTETVRDMAPARLKGYVCKRCQGTGRQENPAGQELPCEACDGERFVTCRAAEPTRSYVATSGEDVLDHGREIRSFVREVQETFEDLAGHIAVWMLEDGQDARLVAVIGPSGVKWI